jgi:hypothetical protein
VAPGRRGKSESFFGRSRGLGARTLGFTPEGDALNNGDIYDLFAGVLRAVLLVALVSSAWLAYRPEDGGPPRQPWIDGGIVLALMGLMWALLDIRNDRISFTSVLVVALAFNVGRWRARREIQSGS